MDADALVVKLEADLASFRSEMLNGQKIVQQSATAIEKSLADMNKKSGGAFGFLRDAAATAAGFIGSQAVLGVLRDAAGAVKDFFASGLEEAKNQENAIQGLNSALAQSGLYSRAASKDMQDYASGLQAATKYGDDAILGVSALIQSVGRLKSTEGLKGATTAALDLSTALGIDLKAAATLVGKAAAGEVSSFTRYGISIDEGKTKAETFANALEALNKQFGGSAANAVKTFDGASKNLGNSFGDIKEEAAGAVTQSGALVNTMNVLSDAFQKAASFIKQNKSGIQDLIKDGIIGLAEGIPLAVKSLQTLSEGFATTYRFAQSLRGLFNDITGDAAGSEDAINKIFESQQADSKRAEAFKALAEQAEILKGKIVDAAEAGAASQDKMNASLEQQSAIAALNVEALSALTEQEQKRLDAQIENGEKLLESEATQATDHLALLERKMEAETAALQKQRDTDLITDQQYQARLLALQQKGADQAVAVKRAEADRKLAIEQAVAKTTSDIVGNMANTVKILNKNGFNTYKGLMKAKALIDTYAAANAAYASALSIPVVGVALAPIAAAAAIAAGLANVVAINSQQMAKGGEIPGIGFGDKIPVMATPGETVIDRSTTDRIKKFFSSENAMIDELRGMRADIRNMATMMPTRFQLVDGSGRVLFDLINAELRAGRRLALGAT